MKVAYQCDHCKRLTGDADPFTKRRPYNQDTGWREKDAKHYCSQGCLISAYLDVIGPRIERLVEQAVRAANGFRERPTETDSLWGASWSVLANDLQQVRQTATNLLALIDERPPNDDRDQDPPG